MDMTCRNVSSFDVQWRDLTFSVRRPEKATSCFYSKKLYLYSLLPRKSILYENAEVKVAIKYSIVYMEDISPANN